MADRPAPARRPDCRVEVMPMLAIYHNRRKAGRALSAELVRRYERTQPSRLVLALSPGGVPVAAEVARALGAPLDLFVAARADGSERARRGGRRPIDARDRT